MPIIGTIASSTRQGLSTTAFESIATATVTSGTSTFLEFTSIPNTYRHLMVRYSIQVSDRVGVGNSNWFMSLNNTTSGSTVYANHYMEGAGTSGNTVSRWRAGAPSWLLYGLFQGSTSFSAGVIEILDYTSTSKSKTVRIVMGNNAYVSSSNNTNVWGSAYFDSTAAISSMKFDSTGGDGPFQIGSTFALYGIKG